VHEASVVFRQALPNGVPVGNPLRWRFRDKLAKTTGGIFQVKIQQKLDPKRCAGGSNDDHTCVTNQDCPSGGACVGYYVFKLRAYGDAERAVEGHADAHPHRRRAVGDPRALEPVPERVEAQQEEPAPRDVPVTGPTIGALAVVRLEGTALLR
jgi:hypothetical protein